MAALLNISIVIDNWHLLSKLVVMNMWSF